MSSQSNRENNYKESDERERIDMVYDNKYDEIYQMGKRQANEIYFEILENDKRNQIENTTTVNMINTQECREDDYLVDTDTDLEHATVHDTEDVENTINKNLTTVIAETKQDDEVLDEKLIMMMLKRQIHKWNKILILILIRNMILLLILKRWKIRLTKMLLP